MACAGQELGVRADTRTAVVVQQVLHVGRSHVVARTLWAGEEAVIRAGWSEQVHRERAALADLQQVGGIPKLLWKGDIYAFGVAVPALVRTFIPGVSLREFRGCEERATDVVDALKKTLEAMHSLGYVHGDVKPSNIVVTNKGDAVFVDFGSTSIQGTHRGPATHGFCRGSNRRSAVDDDLYGLEMTRRWLRRTTEADVDPGIH
jgi:serine/threonine protein kinase